MVIFTIIFSHKFFLKSKKGNGFWTFLKMSNFRVVKEVPKTAQKSRFDHNALIIFFSFYNFVTIIFSFLRQEL
jgi:hypothetical protein